MHGRKKVTQTETEQRVLREKGAAYSAVATAVLDKKQKNEYSVESLTMTEKLLKSNPDFYSLWNFRRNILIHLHTDVFGVFESKESIPFLSRAPLTDGNAAKTLVQKELDMAADGIRKNPKSCKKIIDEISFITLLVYFYLFLSIIYTRWCVVPSTVDI